MKQLDHRLPGRPTSGAEMYLAAILAEVQELRAQVADLAPAAPAETMVINITEPAPGPTAVAYPLPDDFPGRDALIAAGIDDLAAIPADGDQLVAIKGIGKVTAGQILAALKG